MEDTGGIIFFTLKCTKKPLAAGLRLDPLWELTTLPQTLPQSHTFYSGLGKRGKGGDGQTDRQTTLLGL